MGKRKNCSALSFVQKMKPFLTKEDVDIIKSFKLLKNKYEVADLLEVSYSTLVYLLYRPDRPAPYTKFYILKKSGGQREILAPTASLKILQKKLARILSLIYEPRSSVYGFCNNKDILDNARLHANKRVVFNLDLENFFPSIHIGRVIGLFQSSAFSFPKDVAILLAQICCFEGKLPQGAPTSPILSNMICYMLDGALQKLAKENYCLYTRYADDITFSSKSRELGSGIVLSHDGMIICGEKLTSIIKKNNFSINQSKVRLQRPYMRQEVTGLTVNEFSNVSRKYIREIRTILYAWKKFGKANASRVYFQLYPKYKVAPDLEMVVSGKISFIKFIRSSKDPVYRKLKNKLEKIKNPHSIDLPISDIDELRSAVWVVKAAVGYVGTAFMLKDIGLVTCHHVIDGLGGVVEVYNPQINKTYRAEVVRSHMTPDLAILKITQTPDSPLFCLERSDDGPIEVKDTITVIGFPDYQMNDSPQCYEGKVSAKSIEPTIETGLLYIERFTIDKAIYKGMSGSPVVDSHNRVIGVAVHGANDPVMSSRVWGYRITPIHYIDGFVE